MPKLHQNDYAPRNADVFCYIFTSGTTGMPKAAIIRNQRMLGASYLFGRMMHACNGGDIVYVTLPLYHTNAMLLGWGSALATGAGIALRQKFSASSFWLDIVRYQATSFVYIGELCRYLLNTPSIPEERDHRLRVAVGNGLRPDIWNDFTERFNIPLMREFYGSTEGNAPAINFSGRPGMIGKLGHSQLVLRCDPSTGDVIRASNGRCIVAQPGEVGLLVGKISKIMSFEGYLDSRATNAKILSGIRKANDRYFNTGDLVQLHDDNWLSFVDRVGDTFRWKGENVSTTEVAEIINGAQGIVESNVYGVLVPNTDGRAGMAAIRISDHFDLTRFASYVSEELPHYQRPVFLRVLEEEMLVTGTFKHKKVAYRDEGFDPQSITDSLYVRGDGPDYIPLTPDRHAAIVSGQYAQL